MKLSSKKALGFTLIELMIVVTIIGLLSTVSMPKFADMLKRAKQASSKNNLGVLRSVGGIYYADHLGEFAYQLTTIADYSLITALDSIDSNAFVPKYVNEIPAFNYGGTDYAYEGSKDVVVADEWVAGNKFDYDTRLTNEAPNLYAAWVYMKKTGMWYVNCSKEDTSGVIISTW